MNRCKKPYFLNLYLPFPWPDTGSIMSAFTKLERSFEAPEPFSSRSSITALLPNTSSKPKSFKKSMNMNRRFYWEITTFSGKHTFNTHFFCLWMSTFFILNIHFSNPQCPLFSSFKSPLIWRFLLWSSFFSFKKKISEKYFQILCCFVNTFLQVRINLHGQVHF